MKLLTRFKKQDHPSELAMVASDCITTGLLTDSPAITTAAVDLLHAVMLHEGKLS